MDTNAIYKEPTRRIQELCKGMGMEGFTKLRELVERNDKVDESTGKRSGGLDKAEFKDCLDNIGFKLDRGESYDEIFKKFDRDGSGELHATEFMRIVSEADVPKERLEAIKKAFKAIDSDGNWRVDKKELTALKLEGPTMNYAEKYISDIIVKRSFFMNDFIVAFSLHSYSFEEGEAGTTAFKEYMQKTFPKGQ